MRRKHILQLVIVSAALMSGTAQAQAVEQRLQRLERFINNSGLIDMVQRIDSLQDEVRLLRGAVEERDNTINAMRERQRKLYLDICVEVELALPFTHGIDGCLLYTSPSPRD